MMNFSRKQFLAIAAAALAIAGGPAHAETFPARTITMVVPYAGGGTSDVLGRILARRMEQALGQPVIVDLRAGAGGNIGATYVARQAKPDGYTILFAASSLASNVSLLKMGFDPRVELMPVAGVAALPNLMITAADGPYKTAADVFSHARRDPNAITFGSSGFGTGSHLSGEMAKVATGTNLTHVPYKGSGAVYQDLTAGRVSILFDVMGSALPQVQGGRVRPLAITSLKRAPGLPNVPTLAEQGLPNFEMVTWFGMFAPAGTPPDVIQKLNAAIATAIQSPDLRERLQQFGAEPIPVNAGDFGRYFLTDVTRWEELVNSGKIALPPK